MPTLEQDAWISRVLSIDIKSIPKILTTSALNESQSTHYTPNLSKPETLRGLPPEQVKAFIPKTYSGPFPLRKGRGEKYVDFRRLGDTLLIEEGNANHPDPLHQGSYLRISRSGPNGGEIIRIPLRGNPVLGDS